MVYKGKIISYGFNQDRTHRMSRRFKKNPDANFIHAEVDAIKNALYRTDAKTVGKSTLYVARAKKVERYNPNMVFGKAKPCRGCQDCINWFDIKKVFYTEDNGEVGEINA